MLCLRCVCGTGLLCDRPVDALCMCDRPVDTLSQVCICDRPVVLILAHVCSRKEDRRCLCLCACFECGAYVSLRRETEDV